MPNLASVFKGEIARVARRELRGETEPLKKASAKYRSEIAGLKRRLATMEQYVASLVKEMAKMAAEPAEGTAVTRYRFSARGLRTQRKRLGLSAEDTGLLMEVSAGTIYNWEQGKTRPDVRHVEAIVRLRHMGKAEIHAMLEQIRRAMATR